MNKFQPLLYCLSIISIICCGVNVLTLYILGTFIVKKSYLSCRDLRFELFSIFLAVAV